jgi:hypothetical protein
MLYKSNKFCKIASLLFSLALAQFASASALSSQTQMSTKSNENSTKKASHWGLHGMLIFGGKEGLYASHLPMLHAPHDRQLIFRFHLRDAKTDNALRASLAQTPEIWTLEPEEFDLNRLQTNTPNALQQFKGRLVQGHFERKGKERYVQQTIIVDEIIVFNALAPKEQTQSAGHYYVIGTGSEKFLMKKIDRRPDFDILISLKPVPKSETAAELLLPTNTLKLPDTKMLDETLAYQLGKEWKVRKIIYFETADLQ